MGFAAMAPWLVPSAISALGLLFGGGSKDNPLDPEQQAMLNATLRQQYNRMLYQNPLYEQATNLAQNLLPKSASTPNAYQTKFLQPAQPWQTIGNQGFRNPSADAVVIGRAIPRGSRPPETRAATDGATAGAPDNTVAALQALAGGVQSPLAAYRDLMARGRA